MSLVHKMIFLYVLIVFIPMAILGTFYIRSFSVRLQEQHVQSKRDMLEQSCQSIENNLAQVDYCADTFQYNANLIEYVEIYDFASADGAEVYLKTVRPAFEQMAAANASFDRIRIYRKTARKLNDPHYVLNAEDNPELEELGVMNRRNMRMFFAAEGESTSCRIYKALFSNRYYHHVGYMEVVCAVDVMFHPLVFLDRNERMVLTLDGQRWEVAVNGEGKVWLKEFEGELPDYDNSASINISPLEAQLVYYYPDFQVFSNASLLSALIGLALLLLVFTAVYYLIYYSITKRITALTEYMQRYQQDRMTPYKDDPSQDEIGTMIRVYNQTAERINRLIDEIFRQERLVSQAQYYAMQSQIQPHFLYNTLENIDMLIEVGENEKASGMIGLFGKILRYNVSRCREEAVVEEEISHIEDYLKLYAYRMRDDFHYSVSMEKGCEGVRCPYCMLQPVIENCFKHGFRQEERELWIRVSAVLQGDYVRIEVEDNGSGIPKERLQELKEELKEEYPEDGTDREKERARTADSSIGLWNVNERIRLLCGEDCGLRIHAREQGCRVVIILKAVQL